MSKTKKKKRTSASRTAEKEQLRQERAEMRAKENRKALYVLGGFIVTGIILVAMLIATFSTGSSEGYTAGQYQRLETGMSYERVIDLLGGEGSAQDASATEGEGTYVWSNDDGSSITITFRDGVIYSYDQEGLVK